MLKARKTRPLIIAASIGASLALSAPAFAAAGPATGKTGSRFGLNAGAGYSAGVLNTTGGGLGFTWLAGVRYHLNENLFFAIEYQSFGGTNTASGLSSASSALTMYRANANYFLSDGFYAGVNAGLQNTIIGGNILGVPIPGVSTSSLSVGPQVGYMFDLTHGFSLAPEAALHFNLSTPVTMWATGLVRLGYTF